MKTKLLVGAVAALLYGGVALAEEGKDCPPGYENKDTSANLDSQTGDESLSVIQTEPVDSSIGGSGQAGMDDQSGVDQNLGVEDQSLGVDDQSKVDEGFGGSGQAGQEGDMLLRCKPVQKDTGTGGSGEIQQGVSPDESFTPAPNEGLSPDVGAGGSGYQEPLREPQVTPPPAPVSPETSEAFTPIEEQVVVKEESKADMRGLTLTVGGGIEGYTGELAPNINPGPGYGLQAGLKPTKLVGLELAYSGAVNSLDTIVGDLGGEDPEVIRNGGHAAVTLGLTAHPVQPYLLGGIGFDDYNVSGTGAGAAGFRDDTSGNIPVGVGLRTHIGHFTADLRGQYNFLFDQEFALGVDDMNENGRYAGTLNIGGTF